MAAAKTTSQPKSSVTGIQPLGGYILVEPVKQEKTTASGIVLPDTHEGEKPQQGTVVAVGGKMLHDSGQEVDAPVKVGDVVVYKKWGGNEYKPSGSQVEYLFIKFDDILAVVK